MVPRNVSFAAYGAYNQVDYFIGHNLALPIPGQAGTLFKERVMIKRMKFVTPVVLLLALAAVVTACTAGAGAGQQVTAADIMAKMRETMKTTQSAQGTTDITLTINKDGIKALAGTIMGSSAAGSSQMADGLAKLPDSVSVSVNTWHQSPDKARVEVASSTIPNTSGATIVYDGQKAYLFSPSNNTVYTVTPANSTDKLPAELQALMQSGDLQAQLDKLIAATDVKLLGTEKIAGLDAYKLDIALKPDALTTLGLPKAMQMQAGLIAKDLHGTLWVDTNRWIPLKFVVEHPSIGQLTIATSKIDLNKPIDTSKFVLQVPGGAKTVDLDALKDTMTPKASTLQGARDGAAKDGWTLLEPTYLPDSATLVGVTGMGANMMPGGYMLSYSSANSDFTIVEGKSEYQGMLGDGMSGVNAGPNGGLKDVPLRGTTAKAFSPPTGDSTALFWQEKGTGVWVAIHGKISYADAVKIAEGLK